jgi:hypothetical protein
MMNWQHIVPYLAPLLVVALIVWRSIKAKPSPVKPSRLWIRPLILMVATGSVLATTPRPPLLILLALAAAGSIGIAVGIFAGRAVHMSVHPETGVVESRATPIATAIILVLFALRYGMRLMFPEMNAQPGGAMNPHVAAGIIQLTDGLLTFSSAMVAAQAATLWLRARPLILAHAAAKSAGQEQLGPADGSALE